VILLTPKTIRPRATGQVSKEEIYPIQSNQSTLFEQKIWPHQKSVQKRAKSNREGTLFSSPKLISDTEKDAKNAAFRRDIGLCQTGKPDRCFYGPTEFFLLPPCNSC
jgi:hypothetical protein